MRNNSNLEFRKIPSLQFLYEINENGTIVRNIKSKKQLKIILDRHHSVKGYYTTWVNLKGKVVRCPIHKLVAECWLGKRPQGYQIDHIDRNTHNNHYSNLRYCTHSENMRNRQLSERVLEQATANCFAYTMRYVAKPVVLSKNGIRKQFRSMAQAAQYIGTEYSVSTEHVRSKMKKRRSHIYGYDVEYRNAETRRTNSTE